MSEDQTTRLKGPLGRTTRGPKGPLAADAHGDQAAGGAAGGARAQAYLEERRAEDREWVEKRDRILGGGEGSQSDPPRPLDGEEFEDDDYYEEDYEDAGASFFDLFWQYKTYVLAFAAALALLLGLFVFGRGGEEGATPGDPGARPRAAGEAGGVAAAQENAAGPAQDTGVVIGEPVVKEEQGTYYLRAGEIAWKGRLENTDSGEQLTLEGPTAAQFKRAVVLPHGSVMTGVFGRAEPGKPIVHATFHRTTIGEEETTSGTYYAIREDRILVEGSYEDVRDGETVTRTYTEHAPGSTDYSSYKVSFEVPPGVPVPVLVGWEPPAAEKIDEAT